VSDTIPAVAVGEPLRAKIEIVPLQRLLMITVHVKLFAIYQEAYQASEIDVELPPNAPVVAVLDRVMVTHPQLEQWRSHTRFGVNFQFVPPETCLQHGDEVVLIPPVSGG